MVTNQKNSRLVYSTDTGPVCPNCNKPVKNCDCKKEKKKTEINAGRFPKDGIIRIQREKQGRKGKTVTAIYGLSITDEKIGQLARSLKRRCGTGGTVKDGVIYIQGDHREMLQKELQSKGYTAKLAGG